MTPHGGSSSGLPVRRDPVADHRRCDADVAGEDPPREGAASNEPSAVPLEAEASGARLFVVVEHVQEIVELRVVIDPP